MKLYTHGRQKTGERTLRGQKNMVGARETPSPAAKGRQQGEPADWQQGVLSTP